MTVDPHKLAAYLEDERAKIAIPNDEEMYDSYALLPCEVRAIIAALRVDPISRVRLSENDLTDAIEAASAGMPSLSRSGDDDGGWSNRDFAVAILAALEAQLAEDGEA